MPCPPSPHTCLIPSWFHLPAPHACPSCLRGPWIHLPAPLACPSCLRGPCASPPLHACRSASTGPRGATRSRQGQVGGVGQARVSSRVQTVGTPRVRPLPAGRAVIWAWRVRIRPALQTQVEGSIAFLFLSMTMSFKKIKNYRGFGLVGLRQAHKGCLGSAALPVRCAFGGMEQGCVQKIGWDNPCGSPLQHLSAQWAGHSDPARKLRGLHALPLL